MSTTSLKTTRSAPPAGIQPVPRTSPGLRRAISSHPDEDQAVAELCEALALPATSLVILFSSSRRDLRRLEAAVADRFTGPVIGCTTAGEISDRGYTENSIVGLSLAAETFQVATALIHPLDSFDALEAQKLAHQLGCGPEPAPGKQRFGLLLVDGLSMQEERVVSRLHTACGGLSIVGGSAGDDMSYQRTHVLADGRFVSDAAVFCLVETDRPVRTFKTQHLVPTDRKLVITEADPAERRVMEIDGMPASQAYAEALGLTVDQLDAGVFSANPVLLRVGGQNYVRSIQQAEPDGSLVFYCAIDTGLVLTLATGVCLVEDLESCLAGLEQDLGELELVLGCDCILRRLAIREHGRQVGVDRVLRRYPLCGFSTYGEQFNGVHVNQTLTGVAIGGRP